MFYTPYTTIIPMHPRNDVVNTGITNESLEILFEGTKLAGAAPLLCAHIIHRAKHDEEEMRESKK